MAPAVMFHLGHRGKGKNTVGDVFNRFLSQRFCVAICIVFFYYYLFFFFTHFPVQLASPFIYICFILLSWLTGPFSALQSYIAI